MTKVVAIMQARMGSTRLPGKVMRDLIGKPMIVHEVERVQRARTIDGILIATTTLQADDVIARLCRDQGWDCFRGDEQDVLDRYRGAAEQAGASAVVRLTADCPLIEPSVIDLIVEAFCKNFPCTDYASNVFPDRTFPRGLDTEVMTRDALERSWREEKDPALREHVTQHIVKNPAKFHTTCVRNREDLSGYRWTVDTPEDFQFVQEVYRHFGHNRFSMGDVVALMTARPDLADINREIRQKEV